MAVDSEVSPFVLKPEEVPVFSFNHLFDSQPAQAYPVVNGHRFLWAASMYNYQLRSLFAGLVESCQCWAGYYDLVVAACQATACQYLQSSNLLQPLLAQLALWAQLLKPPMAITQLPESVLVAMWGVAADEVLLDILANCDETMKVTEGLKEQNKLLIECTELQQSVARQLRNLSSARHVAGLLQALVAQYQLTHLLPDDIIYNSLRALLAGVRGHGHLRFGTVIHAENVGPAAGSVPPAAPLSSAPAEASAAGMSTKLPTNELTAKDKLEQSAPGSLALVIYQGAPSVSLDSQRRQSVPGDVILRTSDGMTGLDGRKSLQVVEGELGITSLPIATTRQLGSLTTVGHSSVSLSLSDLPKLEDLTGFSRLAQVPSDQQLYLLHKTSDVNELANLQALGLNMVIGANTTLVSQAGLGDLRSISINPKLVNGTVPGGVVLQDAVKPPGTCLTNFPADDLCCTGNNQQLCTCDSVIGLDTRQTTGHCVSTACGGTMRTFSATVATATSPSAVANAFQQYCTGTANCSEAVCAAAVASTSSSVHGNLARGVGSSCAALGQCAQCATSEGNITAGTLEPVGLDLCTSASSSAGSLGLVTCKGAITLSLAGQMMMQKPTVIDAPAVGPSNSAELTLPEVTVPNSGTPTIRHYPLNDKSQPQEPTGVCHDNKAALTGEPHQVHSDEDVILPGPAIKDTAVDDLSNSGNNTETCSNTNTSWRRLFCLRIGKALAATGVAVASMLLAQGRVRARNRCGSRTNRHGASERL